MGALGPHRHPSDRGVDRILDVLDVATGLLGQLFELAYSCDVSFPSGELLVDGLAVVQNRLLCRKLVVAAEAK